MVILDPKKWPAWSCSASKQHCCSSPKYFKRPRAKAPRAAPRGPIVFRWTKLVLKKNSSWTWVYRKYVDTSYIIYLIDISYIWFIFTGYGVLKPTNITGGHHLVEIVWVLSAQATYHYFVLGGIFRPQLRSETVKPCDVTGSPIYQCIVLMYI